MTHFHEKQNFSHFSNFTTAKVVNFPKLMLTKNIFTFFKIFFEKKIHGILYYKLTNFDVLTPIRSKVIAKEPFEQCLPRFFWKKYFFDSPVSKVSTTKFLDEKSKNSSRTNFLKRIHSVEKMVRV